MKRMRFILLLAVMLLIPSRVVLASPMQVPEDVRRLSVELGEQYSICPELIQAVCFKESSFNPRAENDGCIGIMQVNPAWHKDRMERLGVTDLYDVHQNMLTGVDYLHELSEEHEDISIVLMTYNGDSKAGGVENGTADISEYADSILMISAELERENGNDGFSFHHIHHLCSGDRQRTIGRTCLYRGIGCVVAVK